MVGRTILHYEILGELGSGSTGRVYLALDLQTRRKVALKFLDPAAADPAGKARLIREARAASRLSHPGIVCLYGLEEAADELFLVEEFVDGETLANRLAKGGLGTFEVLRLARELCEALRHAHAHGVLHRDLKAANVLIGTDGTYKIADFGIARVEGTGGSSSTGTLMGTLPYMAPERLRGHAGDARSDLFSLGAVLYEAITTRRPFRGSSEAEVLYSVLNEDPATIGVQTSKLQPLADLTMGLLSKEPRDRPASAEIVAALVTELQPRSTPSRGASLARGALIFAGAVLVTVTGLGWWLRYRHSHVLEPQPVAIFRFENVPDPTDSGRFGAIVSNLLVQRLAETGTAHVVSSERVLDLLYQIDRRSTYPDRALARQVARRLHAGLIVTGSILRTTPSILITVEISDATRGRVLDATRAEGLPGQTLFDVVDSLGAHLVGRLPASFEDTLVEPGRFAASRDLAALQRYVEGLEYVAKGDYGKAEVAFENALHRDPQFQQARRQLALVRWLTSGPGPRETPDE